jgi:tRNA-splicing ligase RtcB
MIRGDQTMNSKQLQKIGVPADCMKMALGVVHALAEDPTCRGREMSDRIKSVLADPDGCVEDGLVGPLAQALMDHRDFVLPGPIDYQVWGREGIDDAACDQMNQACRLPSAAGAALMPDAHVGYGLPIGGVLALDGAVAPYAVGVDIACRMKLSVLDTPVKDLSKDSKFDTFRRSLENGTRFGVGVSYGGRERQDHDVMDDERWGDLKILSHLKDKAWSQLGTSGSGNHFVEFGLFTLDQDDPELDLKAGSYVSLLSHSGSRGAGANVCQRYSQLASDRLPNRYKELGRLAWLDLASDAGSEYWLAMNLMGDYAAANHDVIHRNVPKILGARVLAEVENHHNFAWMEVHDGREVVVHRKGATPAGEGVLGVIPGSMADPAYVVRGTGNAASLKSASHGAGRRMSRRKAKEKYAWGSVRKDLEKKGVRVLSAGADEVPGVYKNIDEVMAQQQDLVETVARFDPKIVKMCGDGSRAED